MYRKKLCLGLSSQLGIPFEAQIRLMHRIGFDGFFSNWAPDQDAAVLRSVANETGMMYQSIHAPFGKMADMWNPTEITETAVSELLGCLRDCADNAVEIMVVHAFIGFEDHSPTAFGIDTFGRIVSEVEKLGVKIAFENTEGEEYLAALMDAFRGNNSVGFCWDTGHELCYNYGKDMMALYGDRLIATHLNDNLGIRDFGGRIFWHDDLHLLPFDGIADWQDIARRLSISGFDGPLTFELNTLSKPNRHENDAYGRMSPEEYLTSAYMRACRVAALFNRAV